MPQWSRRRRRIAIIKRVTRIIFMLLIGIGVVLIAFSGFANAALAAPHRKTKADEQIVLDAGLAALRNGKWMSPFYISNHLLKLTILTRNLPLQ